MNYYEKHIFFCTNQRSGRKCCQNAGADDARNYLKKRIKALDLKGKGKVRVNSAGCMDRCEEGPLLVIYPEGVWYTYHNTHDLDEILESHILKGQVVERLLLPNR